MFDNKKRGNEKNLEYLSDALADKKNYNYSICWVTKRTPISTILKKKVLWKIKLPFEKVDQHL